MSTLSYYVYQPLFIYAIFSRILVKDYSILIEQTLKELRRNFEETLKDDYQCAVRIIIIIRSMTTTRLLFIEFNFNIQILGEFAFNIDCKI